MWSSELSTNLGLIGPSSNLLGDGFSYGNRSSFGLDLQRSQIPVWRIKITLRYLSQWVVWGRRREQQGELRVEYRNDEGRMLNMILGQLGLVRIYRAYCLCGGLTWLGSSCAWGIGRSCLQVEGPNSRSQSSGLPRKVRRDPIRGVGHNASRDCHIRLRIFS